MSRLDPGSIESSGRTHVGVVRHANQDAFGESAAEGGERVFIVADGMGGHAGGETASRLAVEAVQETFASERGPVEARLRAALESANRRVYETQLADASLAGMGTTGVALGVGADGVWVANVGDSRAYRLRSGTLTQLTADHSVVAELVRRGFITPEQAQSHPRRNEVLRCLGSDEGVEVDVDEVEVAPEDLFLLCSDGLCGVVDDAEIASLLARQPLEDAAEALVAAANAHGGPDNVTVQIVRVPADAVAGTGRATPAAPGPSPRIVALVAGAVLAGVAIAWWLLSG